MKGKYITFHVLMACLSTKQNDFKKSPEELNSKKGFRQGQQNGAITIFVKHKSAA